jgi:hypothetical protein
MRSDDKKLRYAMMLLLIRNNKPVGDSTLNYFAAIDDYRYTLYRDLKKMDKLKFFPAKYNTKTDLAKSKLNDSKSYGGPDSIVFLDKSPVTVRSAEGFVYFFKYKQRKDDLGWKIATAGLISKDPKHFEIEDAAILKKDAVYKSGFLSHNELYNFTSFTDTKLVADQPISEQLDKQLKIMLYSHRKSAKEFYSVARPGLDDILRLRN